METTGLDTNTCDIIECCCYIREFDYYCIDTLVKPLKQLDDIIIALTGIT